jgi:polyhydroxyalkanoate synthesis regulator phasin
MKPVTIRLEELVDALDAEADDRDVNRTEYVRNILRNREAVRDNTPDNTGEYAETNASEYERTRDNTRENTGEYDALAERLADLEARVEELEAGGGGAISPTALATDTPGADVEPSDAVVDALAASGWSHGRNREERERNAAVAAWALEVLREHGRECRRADVPLDALDDDRKPDTVWHQVVRPAILQVAAETDAVETSTNDQRYRWVGE